MEPEDLEWEDWDPRSISFVHHMIAGSFAGIAEHSVMFPVDTIKTHVQCSSCASPCPKSQLKMTSTEAAIELVRTGGIRRLWRGVSTMLSGCVPAHAAYFTVLESCKERFGVNHPDHHPMHAAAAGAVATLVHDSIMTPMDVVKQRLQLGYHNGIGDCVRAIMKTEGVKAFYISLPTTLFMNLPYGCIMVATNERLKAFLNPSGDFSLSTYMLAGSGAGAVAAALTTPLDLIKTRLQTQLAATVAEEYTHLQHPTTMSTTATTHQHTASRLPHTYIRAPELGAGVGSAIRRHVTVSGAIREEAHPFRYVGVWETIRDIYRKEGYPGFFRGVGPRLLVHMPSVAISWTTYETMKNILKSVS